MPTGKPPPGDVILISGPLGAGKSAVARELVAHLEGPVSYIEGDIFWGFFAKTPGRSLASNAKVLIRAMMLSARAFSKSGYTVVADFTVGPWHFDLFERWMRDAALHFVVLCPSKDICAKHCSERAEGRIDDYAPYGELYDAFAQLPDFEQNIVRDDTASAAQLASGISGELRSGRYRVAL